VANKLYGFAGRNNLTTGAGQQQIAVAKNQELVLEFFGEQCQQPALRHRGLYPHQSLRPEHELAPGQMMQNGTGQLHLADVSVRDAKGTLVLTPEYATRTLVTPKVVARTMTTKWFYLLVNAKPEVSHLRTLGCRSVA